MNLKIQTGINSLGSAVLLGFQWLISVCLVRINGYEDAGVFALAMTVSNVFSMIANYGLRNYQLTDQKRVFYQQQYILMRLQSSIAVMLICCIFLFFQYSYSVAEKYAIILYLVYNLSIVVSDSLMGTIQLKNHLEINGFSNMIRGVLCFLLFIMTLIVTHILVLSLFMMSIGSAITLLFFDIPLYRKYATNYSETIKDSIIGASKLYWEGLPIMLSSVVPMMVTAYPRTSIQQLLGSEALGYYTSLYTPAVIISTVIPPALVALIPVISTNWQERQLKNLTKNIVIEYLVVFVAVFLILILEKFFGHTALVLLYGQSISPFSFLLRYAIVSTGMNCFCICGSNILVALNARTILLLSSFFSLAVILLFSARFVTTWGLAGASIVQISAYGVQALIQIVYMVVLIANAKIKKSLTE